MDKIDSLLMMNVKYSEKSHVQQVNDISILLLDEIIQQLQHVLLVSMMNYSLREFYHLEKFHQKLIDSEIKFLKPSFNRFDLAAAPPFVILLT